MAVSEDLLMTLHRGKSLLWILNLSYLCLHYKIKVLQPDRSGHCLIFPLYGHCILKFIEVNILHELNVFPCCSEGGVEHWFLWITPRPFLAHAQFSGISFFRFSLLLCFRTPRRIAAAEFKETVDGYFKEDKRQPLSLSSCSNVCLVR